jgi:hypothetical protein
MAQNSGEPNQEIRPHLPAIRFVEHFVPSVNSNTVLSFNGVQLWASIARRIDASTSA